jgi:hypothetical protein
MDEEAEKVSVIRSMKKRRSGMGALFVVTMVVQVSYHAYRGTIN